MYPNNQPDGGPQTRDHQTATASAHHTQRRIDVLERGSARLVQRAAEAQVNITYLGTTSLFSDPQAYYGEATDWIIGPAADLSDAIIPRIERDALTRLVRSGIEFPLIYIAHEVPKHRIALLTGESLGGEAQAVTLSKAAATEAVGPVPYPVAATDLADRLGRMSHDVLSTIGKALPIVGAIAATPFVLAGALGMLLIGLDPIVFGVIPAGRAIPGQPAAWYLLARWEWPDGRSVNT